MGHKVKELPGQRQPITTNNVTHGQNVQSCTIYHPSKTASSFRSWYSCNEQNKDSIIGTVTLSMVPARMAADNYWCTMCMIITVQWVSTHIPYIYLYLELKKGLIHPKE